MNSVALIIPSAGSGKRLNRDIPKPYIKIAGKTILEHTLLKFKSLPELDQVIIATAEQYLDTSLSILEKTLPDTVEFECVIGGEERQHSVYNALQEIGKVDLIAVHDAVRPFVSHDVLRRCIESAFETGGAVVGVKAKDTIKKVDENLLIKNTPRRTILWQAQTPQIFKKDILIKAYQNAMDEGFLGTDDSSLVERMGYQIKMVEGDLNNFKITYPIDLKLARLLLNKERV